MTDAPLHTDLDPGLAGGVAHRAVAEDGTGLRFAVWAAEGPARGTALVVPGRAECIERYGDPIRRLRGLGFVVLVVDVRGQGLSDRLLPQRNKGHVGRFSDYQADLRAILAHPAAKALPRPLVMVAHSMGSAIGWRAMLEGLDVAAAVHVAPFLGLPLPRWVRPLAAGTAALLAATPLARSYAYPKADVPYPLYTPFEGNVLTTDPACYQHFIRILTTCPELGLGAPTFGWIAAAMAETRALRATRAPDVPTLLLCGTDETVVDPAPIAAAAEAAPNARIEWIEGARHGLLMEAPGLREQLWSHIGAHLDAAVPR